MWAFWKRLSEERSPSSAAVVWRLIFALSQLRQDLSYNLTSAFMPDQTHQSDTGLWNGLIRDVEADGMNCKLVCVHRAVYACRGVTRDGAVGFSKTHIFQVQGGWTWPEDQKLLITFLQLDKPFQAKRRRWQSAEITPCVSRDIRRFANMLNIRLKFCKVSGGMQVNWCLPRHAPGYFQFKLAKKREKK